MQNAKLSLTQWSRTCRKVYGLVPIVQKYVQQDTQKLKLFKRYVDDTVCTAKGKPIYYLEHANSLQKNLQFIFETTNGFGDLTFLYLNIKLNEVGKFVVIGTKN